MNNKGADQFARLRRLVCGFVVQKPPKTDLLAWRPNYIADEERKQTLFYGDTFLFLFHDNIRIPITIFYCMTETMEVKKMKF